MHSPDTTTDVEAAVRAFIADNYLYREGVGSIADTDSFLARGIIDSMGILELVTFLESTFGISVADDEVVPDNLDSVAKVAAYVRRKLGAGA
jgi:acyl carrier protein